MKANERRKVFDAVDLLTEDTAVNVPAIKGKNGVTMLNIDSIKPFHDHPFHLYFLGGYDGLLYALIVFMVVDYITGVMCAVSDKKLSSAVGFKGICRKVLILMLVGIANLLDVQVIGTGAVLRTAVIFFYLSNEGVSLLENAAHLGLPIPEKLKAILAQLHDRAEGDGDDNEIG